MKAICEGVTVEVWKISETDTLPPWVDKAFNDSQISWGHLPDSQMKFLRIGKAYVGPTAMFSMDIAPLGDYLVFDGKEYKCVSKRKFRKHYQEIV